MHSRIAPAETPWSPVVDRRLKTLPPLLLFRVLARDDRLFARFMDGGLLDKGHLTLRERELAILTVCARNGSDYEWGVHVQLLSEAAGFTPAEIAATARPHAEWTGRDALQSSCELEDEFWTELRAEFSEMALLELLLVIGKYRQVCILTNALRLESEAGAPRIPPAE